jgi:hypothetical protein
MNKKKEGYKWSALKQKWQGTCKWYKCGAKFWFAPKGRWPEYCSTACKQAFWRWRMEQAKQSNGVGPDLLK